MTPFVPTLACLDVTSSTTKKAIEAARVKFRGASEVPRLGHVQDALRSVSYKNVHFPKTDQALGWSTVYIFEPVVSVPSLEELRLTNKARYTFSTGSKYGSLVDLVANKHGTKFPMDLKCRKARGKRATGRHMAITGFTDSVSWVVEVNSWPVFAVDCCTGIGRGLGVVSSLSSEANWS